MADGEWRYEEGLPEFLAAVRYELRRARELHRPIASAHEGYAVIAEELDEFWDEVRLKEDQRLPGRMYAELVQVAAMAMRVAEDVVAIELEG